jgi:hypothetical protein
MSYEYFDITSEETLGLIIRIIRHLVTRNYKGL